MEKTKNKIIVFLFIGFLITIGILNLLTPDRDFSQDENRVLSKFPKLSIKNIISGRFTKKFESYAVDQFIFRDFWVGLKSDIERFTLKNENKGIFFGKDGYLLENFKRDDKTLEDNIKSINYFINETKDLKTYLLLAPNSVSIYDDKLPFFASPYDQTKIIDKVKDGLNDRSNFINVYPILRDKKEEYIYFKTDHHWTMRGSYYSYKKLSEAIGIKPYVMDDFTIEVVADDFYGTYYSKANNKHLNGDFIEVFRPNFDISYSVNYVYDNKKSDTLYELNHLDKRDKYSIFLDGNHSLVTIKSDVKNDKKLVIFKDSYSHNFIPFLANHYKEIHIIDLRYYKANVYEYIKKNNIKEALFLYNIKTFSEDKNIRWLKR